MRVIPVFMSEDTLDMLLHLVDKVSHTRDPFYTKEEIEELYSKLAQLKENVYKDILDEREGVFEHDEMIGLIDFSNLEHAYDRIADLIEFLEKEEVDDTVVEKCRKRAAAIQELIMEFVRKNYPDAVDE